MPIRLTAVGGPLDGQTFEFGPNRTLITLGRLEDRDIRFPGDFRPISRAHLAIACENGKYYLRPDGPVFVDGHQALRDEELPRRCELRLGSPAGPGFKVEWNIASDLPSTSPPAGWERQTPVRAALKATARARKLAVAAVGLVLLVAAAAVAYVVLQPEPITDRLAAARRSVYYVVLVDETGKLDNNATAWVVAPGWLATNAHVTDAIEKGKEKGIKAYVRANFPPYESHEVIETIEHPHYKRYAEIVSRHAPVTPAGRLLSSMNAYDVGLLRVAADAKLAPPLKLAETEALHALKPGDEVGYIGYPSEGMSGGVNINAPTPQMHIAKITAVTDYYMTESRPPDRFLIQHTLATAGGSSGSPVFNGRGEVIAVHNAGNYKWIRGTRVHAAQFAYAQRVDLLTEILGVKLEAILLKRDDEWEKRVLALPSAPDYLVRQFGLENKLATVKPALEVETVLEKRPNLGRPVALVHYEIEGPGNLLFLALERYPRKLRLYLLDPAKNNKQIDSNESDIFYPWVEFEAEKRQKVLVVVMGEDVGQKVPLRIYFAPEAKAPKED